MKKSETECAWLVWVIVSLSIVTTIILALNPLRGDNRGNNQVIFLLYGVLAYFVPVMVANLRQHPNRLAILILNIFLGWTFLGWVAALVWAVTVSKPSEIKPA